ncbi:hypothetical protein [Edwardsiella tarda]|uniref:hypothetical protein n=1 Tax=Edwardsiella tarda TaxID=636 RepID=UPI0006828BB9|nr:hypothetical protein [Edwardsiella tarda]
MSKTPCEKLGYEVGDKFVVVREGNRSIAEVGDVLTLEFDDGSDRPHCGVEGSCCRILFPQIDDIAKIDADGWIEWKGGEMPVARGTLVDVKCRDGKETVGVSAGIHHLSTDYRRKAGCSRSAKDWEHYQCDADIVAYRLHQEEKPELEQVVPTLDSLLHAWQKAKANADTSRNILKLAEQDEAAARKALDDALRAAGWGDAKQDELLNITDWRDLKVGDIIWWSGDENFDSGEYTVDDKEWRHYCGDYPFAIRNEYGAGEWVDTDEEQWCFIRRPS